MIRILFFIFMIGVFQKQEASLIKNPWKYSCPISRGVPPEEAAEWEK